jgi:hypothetical protein
MHTDHATTILAIVVTAALIMIVYQTLVFIGHLVLYLSSIVSNRARNYFTVKFPRSDPRSDS